MHKKLFSKGRYMFGEGWFVFDEVSTETQTEAEKEAVAAKAAKEAADKKAAEDAEKAKEDKKLESRKALSQLLAKLQRDELASLLKTTVGPEGNDPTEAFKTLFSDKSIDIADEKIADVLVLAKKFFEAMEITSVPRDGVSFGDLDNGILLEELGSDVQSKWTEKSFDNELKNILGSQADSVIAMKDKLVSGYSALIIENIKTKIAENWPDSYFSATKIDKSKCTISVAVKGNDVEVVLKNEKGEDVVPQAQDLEKRVTAIMKEPWFEGYCLIALGEFSPTEDKKRKAAEDLVTGNAGITGSLFMSDGKSGLAKKIPILGGLIAAIKGLFGKLGSSLSAEETLAEGQKPAEGAAPAGASAVPETTAAPEVAALRTAFNDAEINNLTGGGVVVLTEGLKLSENFVGGPYEVDLSKVEGASPLVLPRNGTAGSYMYFDNGAVGSASAKQDSEFYGSSFAWNSNPVETDLSIPDKKKIIFKDNFPVGLVLPPKARLRKIPNLSQ